MKKTILAVCLLVLTNISISQANQLSCNFTDNNVDLPAVKDSVITQKLSTGERLIITNEDVNGTQKILVQKLNKRGYPVLRLTGENTVTLILENPKSGIELYVQCNKE